MTHFDDYSGACPVPLEELSAFYRADAETLGAMIASLGAAKRVELAVYCYGRAHFRELGLTIAARCDAHGLIRFAGVLGQVLASQSRGRIQDFGHEGSRGAGEKRRVTLAKSAA